MTDKELFSILKESKLLCVEDDREGLEGLLFLMQTYFGEVEIASSAFEALACIEKGGVDVVLTDLRMPRMDGLSLVRAIRKEDENMPIVLMTGFNDRKVLAEAINLGVNGFLAKPIDRETLERVFKKIAKSLLVEKMLQEQEEYRLMQETMGVSKELHLLRNDYYYQTIDDAGKKMVNFIYAPLDRLSGDAYSMRKMANGNIFFLLVDGMGKGLSASLTSMMLTGYVNHRIDRMNRTGECSFKVLIEDALTFLRSILLPEEIVSLSFICIEGETPIMKYATFSMPAMLNLKIKNKKKVLQKIPSNNPPASCYTKDFKISQTDLEDTVKFLAYSDGLNENSTKEGGIYNDYLIEDFLSVLTRNEMKERFLERIAKQEDDVTMIQYIDVTSLTQRCESKRFRFTLERYEEEILPWYENFLYDNAVGSRTRTKASLVFTELILNAHEHGNLGIDALDKDRMIVRGEYDEYLEKRTASSHKEIEVTLCRICFGERRYVTVAIEDEGEGFDTRLLRELFFKKSHRNNGRGVVISQKNTLGIYYNPAGNRVIYFLPIEEE